MLILFFVPAAKKQLIRWMAASPDWVEQWYSRGLYPYLSGFFRRLYGWVPFSVGDLLYLGLLAAFLIWLVRNRAAIRKNLPAFLRDLAAKHTPGKSCRKPPDSWPCGPMHCSNASAGIRFPRWNCPTPKQRYAKGPSEHIKAWGRSFPGSATATPA